LRPSRQDGAEIDHPGAPLLAVDQDGAGNHFREDKQPDETHKAGIEPDQ
jgi:hypothetical protein